VCVLSTGGTISGRGSSPTDLSNYRSGGVLGDDVVKGVPQICQFATVKVEQIVNVGSPDITTENWLTIANRLSAIFADPAVAGVVVTQGTSTTEETACFLHLTVKDDRPVVLV
jgi:L-asparaginase